MTELETCSVCQNDIPEGEATYRTGRNRKKTDERTYCGHACREFAVHRQHTTTENLQLQWIEHVALLKAERHFIYAAKTLVCQ